MAGDGRSELQEQRPGRGTTGSGGDRRPRQRGGLGSPGLAGSVSPPGTRARGSRNSEQADPPRPEGPPGPPEHTDRKQRGVPPPPRPRAPGGGDRGREPRSRPGGPASRAGVVRPRRVTLTRWARTLAGSQVPAPHALRSSLYLVGGAGACVVAKETASRLGGRVRLLPPTSLLWNLWGGARHLSVFKLPSLRTAKVYLLSWVEAAQPVGQIPSVRVLRNPPTQRPSSLKCRSVATPRDSVPRGSQTPTSRCPGNPHCTGRLRSPGLNQAAGLGAAAPLETHPRPRARLPLTQLPRVTREHGDPTTERQRGENGRLLWGARQPPGRPAAAADPRPAARSQPQPPGRAEPGREPPTGTKNTTPPPPRPDRKFGESRLSPGSRPDGAALGAGKTAVSVVLRGHARPARLPATPQPVAAEAHVGWNPDHGRQLLTLAVVRLLELQGDRIC
ncbi:collagen alpha-1(I) chain-like [Choloepus didactylus]|uniref:collagen alpha-1(I) chain-like n=1 Tax=Choloepus didactylus TaxID=27675 RepID=UPI00189FCA8E|nr:collagen alpha-1(I) chain-like [Choloepus didactylus]